MDDQSWGWVRPPNTPSHFGHVRPNDPRIPPPAPDPITLSPEGAIVAAPENPSIVLPTPKPLEEDMPAKIGIYATGGDQFAVSVLDESNDPVDGGSFKFDAATIMAKIKPMLEAAGHKVVDYTAGSLVEATAVNVTPIRRRAAK